MKGSDINLIAIALSGFGISLFDVKRELGKIKFLMGVNIPIQIILRGGSGKP